MKKMLRPYSNKMLVVRVERHSRTLIPEGIANFQPKGLRNNNFVCYEGMNV